MSKSIKKKLVTLMVVGVMAVPMAIFAGETLTPISENEAVVISEKEQQENKYIKYSGEIVEVIDNKDNISILVNSGAKEDEYGMVFHISENVSLWNRDSEKLIKAKDLEKGMSVEVFFNQNTPTTMSLPPQLTPGVIVVQAKEAHGQVFMGEFGEDLVSTDNVLKLNIGEDTVIVSEKGEELAEKDIAGNAALVFYGISTKSIPAQTTPSKVVVLVEKENVVEDVVEGEEIVEETKEMISLRDVATTLGYKVGWSNEDKTVTLTKENQTITMKLNSVDYTLNKSLGKFSKAPELRNGNFYVSASVVEFMN